MEKIRFQLEDGTFTEFYILKDVSKDTSLEALYEIVEDEEELQAVFKVFEQMLEDVDLEM